MAMLIVIFGVGAWIKTPVDIFPNIGIPVVAVVWTYGGVPPDDMSERIIYYYERTLTSQVNDIEHIESQSLHELRHRQDLLPAGRQHQRRAGASHGRLADGAQISAGRHHAALCAELQRLQRAGAATGAVEHNRSPRRASSTWGRTSSARSSPASPAPRFPRLTAARSCRCRSTSTSTSCRPTACRRRTSSTRSRQQNIVTPVGDAVVGKVRIYHHAQRLARHRFRRLNNIPIKVVNGAHRLSARRRLRPCRRAAADQHGARQWRQCGADDDPEGGLGVDARRHQRRQGAAAEAEGNAAREPQARRGRRSVRIRQRSR